MNRFWVKQSLLVSLMLVMIIVPIGVGLRFFLEDSFDENDAINVDNSHDGIPPGLLLMIGVSVVIGASVGVIGSRSLSLPIETLVRDVKKIGSGKLGHQVKLTNATQEFQELSTAINQMSIELRDAEVHRQRLMADVSHELRTPLTILEGHLRAALDDVYALDEAQIATLYSQAHHLIKLVDDLNLLSNAEANRLPLNIEPINVLGIAKEVFNNFVLVADEKNIILELSHDDNLKTIQLDAIRLRQILSNLLDNAIRYTPENGEVNIKIKQSDKSLQIIISNTGKGINSEQIDYVFDRFYRTDYSRSRNSGGIGLGLAIVKALVEVQGGTITAQSKDYKLGTDFIISFLMD